MWSNYAPRSGTQSIPSALGRCLGIPTGTTPASLGTCQVGRITCTQVPHWVRSAASPHGLEMGSPLSTSPWTFPLLFLSREQAFLLEV